MNDIKNLYAFELFCQNRFEESLKVFRNLNTGELIIMLMIVWLYFISNHSRPDPAQVIGLFPGLLPPDYKRHLHYPSEPPILSGIHFEKALHALIEYLTEVSPVFCTVAVALWLHWWSGRGRRCDLRCLSPEH